MLTSGRVLAPGKRMFDIRIHNKEANVLADQRNQLRFQGSEEEKSDEQVCGIRRLTSFAYSCNATKFHLQSIRRALLFRPIVEMN